MYQKYKDKDLVILGFPCNQFGKQEQGSSDEISEFCEINYGVSFPMFEKITVKEGIAHPFYNDLANSAGTHPKWNFHKYLIGKDGELITDFSTRTKPYDEKVITAINKALSEENS